VFFRIFVGAEANVASVRGAVDDTCLSADPVMNNLLNILLEYIYFLCLLVCFVEFAFASSGRPFCCKMTGVVKAMGKYTWQGPERTSQVLAWGLKSIESIDWME